LTVFLDIDTTLMAFYDSSLIQEFVKEFYGCYELIPTIICEIVEERIKDYAESEELKKLALYHLGCLTMHVELKVSHFPVIFDKISTKLLSTNENLQRYGHLACLKKVSILHVYDKSFFLLSRKYRSGWECDPEATIIQSWNRNPLNVLKDSGFFNQLPTGSNFHYKYINSNESYKCKSCGEAYFYKRSDDVYIECKIAEGVAIDGSKSPKNLESEKIVMWFQSPFLDYLCEGQTVSVTGYFFMIPNFHWKKVGGKVMYPLKIGCAAFNICPVIDGDIDIAIMDEIEGGASSLLTSNLNLKEFLNKQTQQTTLMFKAKNYKKDRKNFIYKATQNQSISSVPLSFSHMTDQFWENPGYVDRESFENWTDPQLISEELNKEMIRLRNLIRYIFDDVEYFTEDNRSYLHLFHFKLAMLLSIISTKRDYLSKCIPDEKDVNQSVSAAESIGQSLTGFCTEDIDFESKFSHVADVSSILNLLFVTDDSCHLNKIIEMSSNICGNIHLPSQIDMSSLNMFLKVNEKKVIIINFAYFKWNVKTKKIFQYLLYLNKRGKINNPIWMVVDTNDLDAQKCKSLKSVFGRNIYDWFDIWLSYDQEITKCIGVSYFKHWNMNAMQNMRFNDFKHQIKVKNLEFPAVIGQNKCIWDPSTSDDLLMKLNFKSVNVENLISNYYWWRKEQSDVTKINMSPNRLSLVYKVAENINFLRCLYLKNSDNLDENLDIVDGVVAIFFNELTAINDRSVSYSDKQLIRSYCIERVMSRMESKPFYELATGKSNH